jgi:hypothetical protein
VAIGIVHHKRVAGARLGYKLAARAFHRGQTEFTFDHGSPHFSAALDAPQFFAMTKCPPDGAVPKSPGWRCHVTQAIPSPQGDECNSHGEVTEKFRAGAKYDIMATLFCRVCREPV